MAKTFEHKADEVVFNTAIANPMLSGITDGIGPKYALYVAQQAFLQGMEWQRAINETKKGEPLLEVA